jgi:hypothetical protein
MRAAVLALACAGCATSPATNNFNRPFEPWVPRDVRLFVIDAQACWHFSGEVGHEEERRAFLQRMIKESCSNLDKRKSVLVRKYGRSPETMKLISDVTE